MSDAREKQLEIARIWFEDKWSGMNLTRQIPHDGIYYGKWNYDDINVEAMWETLEFWIVHTTK